MRTYQEIMSDMENYFFHSPDSVLISARNGVYSIPGAEKIGSFYRELLEKESPEDMNEYRCMQHCYILIGIAIDALSVAANDSGDPDIMDHWDHIVYQNLKDE